MQHVLHWIWFERHMWEYSLVSGVSGVAPRRVPYMSPLPLIRMSSRANVSTVTDLTLISCEEVVLEPLVFPQRSNRNILEHAILSPLHHVVSMVYGREIHIP